MRTNGVYGPYIHNMYTNIFKCIHNTYFSLRYTHVYKRVMNIYPHVYKYTQIFTNM